MASSVLTDKIQDSLFNRTESGGLSFNYFETFDKITGESDHYSGEFPKDEYEESKKQLTATGSCNISGYNCTLEITRINGNFRIFFNGQNKATIFFTKTLEGFL